MPDAVGGRYTDPGNQGRELAELRKAVAQLQRLMANRPKILAPSAAGALTLGVTRAEATTTRTAGGASTSGWSFSAFDWDGWEAPSLVGSTFGHFNPVESGAYCIKAHLGIGWSSPPANVTVFVNPATTTAMSDYHQLTQTVAVPASGTLMWDVSFGPVFLYGDGLDPSMSGVGLLGLDVEWAGGSTATFAEIWLDVTRAS